MKEALFYTRLEDNSVSCSLCPHGCTIKNGARGLCGVRENRNGTLETLVYGKAIAENADPIEKKPLFHFLPGSISYSIATVGCNLTCKHCQNSDISQYPRSGGPIPGTDRSPEDIVRAAQGYGCQSIAYTYTEPTIYFEYALDIAKLARQAGIRNVFVTNGFTGREAIETIAPYLDAANVDLKCFSNDTYRQICGARLDPVLETIRTYKQLGIWVEVTTLIISGYNDTADELESISGFIADTGTDIPWHVTAFYPTYQMTDRPPTTADMLIHAQNIGYEKGLRYVYTGNIRGQDGENTYCHQCGSKLIGRYGFCIRENNISGGLCPGCNAKVDGVLE